MYIPIQQQLVEETPSPPTDSPFGYELIPGLYFLGVRPAVETTQQDPSFNVPSAFVGVSVAASIFLLLVVVFVTYKKCTSDDPDSTSDTVSTVSESAWRVEDPESASEATDTKHRKRLRKLDQVAPIQSLHDWRAEKLLTHVETFATVSTKLICAICLDLIGEDEKIRELHCGHVYHSACLNLWVERGHHDCPLCKYDILGMQENPPKAPEAENTSNEAGGPPPRHHGPHVVLISNVQPPA